MVDKAVLIQTVKSRAGIKGVTAVLCVDSVLETMRETLEKGETIRIRELGTFCVARKASRNFRALSGEINTVPAHGVVMFKASPELKKAVWNKGQK